MHNFLRCIILIIFVVKLFDCVEHRNARKRLSIISQVARDKLEKVGNSSISNWILLVNQEIWTTSSCCIGRWIWQERKRARLYSSSSYRISCYDEKEIDDQQQGRDDCKIKITIDYLFIFSLLFMINKIINLE